MPTLSYRRRLAVAGAAALLCSPAAGADFPDLGTIRYRDPAARRSLWLGVEGSGAYIPRSWGLFNRTVWTVESGTAWALALTSEAAVGGRHALVWYDARNIRLRIQLHELEIAVPLLGSGAAGRDRLAAGIEFHGVDELRVRRADGSGHDEIFVGGLGDTVLRLGYGWEHALGERMLLGWCVQGRYVWIFLDTQRQVRASARLSLLASPEHRLILEGVGFFVHRDPRQAGEPLLRASLHGQLAAGWEWLTRAGVVVAARGRLLSSFMSGEVPMYEIREESLDRLYGELELAMRVVWE